MDQTLRPTTHTASTTGVGQVLDPSRAYDADPATYAALVCNATSCTAAIVLAGLPDDSDVTLRSTVTLRARLREVGWDADSYCWVYFRPAADHAWTLVDSVAAGEAAAATWLEFDVTALTAGHPSTGWEIGLVFTRTFDPPGLED